MSAARRVSPWWRASRASARSTSPARPRSSASTDPPPAKAATRRSRPAQAVVLGDDGPAVGQLADLAPAGVDHRLDGEDHAGRQPLERARPAVVQDLRLLVEAPADAVAAELAHDREAVLLGVALDGVADVAEVASRPDPRDAGPHALVGHLAQPACRQRRLADVEHAAGVAVIAVLDHRDVDVHDVAVLQRPLARHAVADLVVDRSADRLRKRAVAGRRVVERRRNRALLADHVVVAEPVQLAGRHPGLHVRRDEVEDFGRQAAGDPHPRDVLRGLDRYGHRRRLG